MTLFSEHRLIYRLATDFGFTSSQAAKKSSRANVVTKKETSQKSRNAQRDQRADVAAMNRAAGDLGRDVSFSRQGVAGSRGTEIYGKTGDKAFSTGLTQNVSAEQRRSASRMKEESAIRERHAADYNKRIASGDWIGKEDYEYARDQEIAQLNETFRQRDATNTAQAQQRSERSRGVTKRGDIAKEKLSTSSMQERSQARGQTRAARLGLEAPTTGEEKQTSISAPKGPTEMPLTGGSPVVTEEGELPTDVYEGYTKRSREAAGALDSDTLDAPDSVEGLVDEEMEAVDPLLAAMDKIRGEFKIYQKGAQSLLDERGKQIEEYKTGSIDRAEQAADAKVTQSKANRDLELEIINEARDRARRDAYLLEDQEETQYEREEDRIISENQDRIERMETSLGGRYGGFGSGKGLKKIQSARDEGSRVLRELNEDRIYARKDTVNKIMDIESDWKLDRKETFNRHDQNITNAFTALVEQAQAVDDNALEEEGDKIEKGITLLKEGFDTMDKIWTTTGTELSAANRRALDRRDALRKEEYDKKQDAISNIVNGLSVFPSNSPYFKGLEEAAGLTPGTIAGAVSFEERRMMVSEAGLRINQRELQLQLDKFERDGNVIDHQVSQSLGYLVTSTGEVFRDYFGNPVNLVGQGGSVTSSISNDSKLYGSASVGMGSAVNFSRYALQMGDMVPGSPYHKGGEYDIDNVAGTPIPVWNSGTVTRVNQDPNGPYGIYVDVFDGVNTTRYAHLEAANVQEGMYINGTNSGQASIVGTMGNTGNVMSLDGQRPVQGDTQTGSHLHLEVRTGNDFDRGQVLDPMDVGMVPGQMHSGKIVWVDEMRQKMKQGEPIGSSARGGTFSSSQIDTPWQEVDQQILELAKDVFRDPEGKTDWRAVELVYDYLQQNKMGQYQVSYTGEGAVQGTQQASKEIEYNAQIHKRQNVTADRDLVKRGVIDAEEFYESLTDGTLAEMTEAEAEAYMYDMGYVVDEGVIGHSVAEMDKSELQILNQRRQAAGLPPLQ